VRADSGTLRYLLWLVAMGLAQVKAYLGSLFVVTVQIEWYYTLVTLTFSVLWIQRLLIMRYSIVNKLHFSLLLNVLSHWNGDNEALPQRICAGDRFELWFHFLVRLFYLHRLFFESHEPTRNNFIHFSEAFNLVLNLLTGVFLSSINLRYLIKVKLRRNLVRWQWNF